LRIGDDGYGSGAHGLQVLEIRHTGPPAIDASPPRKLASKRRTNEDLPRLQLRTVRAKSGIRTYRVRMPTAEKVPQPVILFLHGEHDTADRFEGQAEIVAEPRSSATRW